MVVKASGALNTGHITAEFVGDNPPHSLSEFYGDGLYVPTGIGIPDSGVPISFSHFYGKTNALAPTVVLNLTSGEWNTNTGQSNPHSAMMWVGCIIDSWNHGPIGVFDPDTRDSAWDYHFGNPPYEHKVGAIFEMPHEPGAYYAMRALYLYYPADTHALYDPLYTEGTLRLDVVPVFWHAGSGEYRVDDERTAELDTMFDTLQLNVVGEDLLVLKKSDAVVVNTLTNVHQLDWVGVPQAYFTDGVEVEIGFA